MLLPYPHGGFRGILVRSWGLCLYPAISSFLFCLWHLWPLGHVLQPRAGSLNSLIWISSSLFIHFHYEYCSFPMMLAQNSSTSSRVGGSVTSTSILFTVKFFGKLKGFILQKEFSSFLKSSDSLRLSLDLLFKYFLFGCQVCRVLYVITFQHLLLFSFLDPAALFHLHQDR